MYREAHKMRRIYQVASVLFIAFGILILIGSIKLRYYTDIGPGAGFFPRWVGLAFTALSIAWFFEVTLKPVEPMPADLIPERAGQLRVLAIVGALAAAIWLVGIIGFSLTMLPFLLFTITVLGRQSFSVTAAIAIGGSFGVSYVFAHFLDVYLPSSPFELLNQFGI
jgi:putative tricarboxylic transport membrane protein